MKTTESDVLRSCLDYLRIKSHLVARINSGAFKTESGNYVRSTDISGISDIIGIAFDGRALAVECKSDTGRLSRQQEIFKAAWIARGGLYVLARGIDDLKEAGL